MAGGAWGSRRQSVRQAGAWHQEAPSRGRRCYSGASRAGSEGSGHRSPGRHHGRRPDPRNGPQTPLRQRLRAGGGRLGRSRDKLQVHGSSFGTRPGVTPRDGPSPLRHRETPRAHTDLGHTPGPGSAPVRLSALPLDWRLPASRSPGAMRADAQMAPGGSPGKPCGLPALHR